MPTETAMMLHHPDMDHPYDPFNGREVEPVTEAMQEWVLRLTKDKRVCEDVLKTNPDIRQRRAAGTRYIAICDRLAELARREAERSA